MTRQQILRYAKRVLLSLSVETHNELSDCKGKYFFCFSKIIADIFLVIKITNHLASVTFHLSLPEGKVTCHWL